MIGKNKGNERRRKRKGRIKRKDVHKKDEDEYEYKDQIKEDHNEEQDWLGVWLSGTVAG